jgi:hypothetical protein
VRSERTTMRVAKFAIADMIPLTIAQAISDPCEVLPLCTMGPIPFARTIAQMKNATPAVGTTYAFTVNKWRIL